LNQQTAYQVEAPEGAPTLAPDRGDRITHGDSEAEALYQKNTKAPGSRGLSDALCGDSGEYGTAIEKPSATESKDRLPSIAESRDYLVALSDTLGVTWTNMYGAMTGVEAMLSRKNGDPTGKRRKQYEAWTWQRLELAKSTDWWRHLSSTKRGILDTMMSTYDSPIIGVVESKAKIVERLPVYCRCSRSRLSHHLAELSRLGVIEIARRLRWNGSERTAEIRPNEALLMEAWLARFMPSLTTNRTGPRTGAAQGPHTLSTSSKCIVKRPKGRILNHSSERKRRTKTAITPASAPGAPSPVATSDKSKPEFREGSTRASVANAPSEKPDQDTMHPLHETQNPYPSVGSPSGNRHEETAEVVRNEYGACVVCRHADCRCVGAVA
jgi:hypothetical protein